MPSTPTRLLVLIALLLASACAMPPGPLTQPVPSREVSVAVLPITDVIPLYVAQAEGIFTGLDIEVSLVPVASSAERDTLLQAGQVDCALNEILGTVLFNAGESEGLRVVATALRASPEAAHFYLLSTPGSGLIAPNDLDGSTVAISENTIIEYWTDRILAQRGIDPTLIATTNVPRIPVRLELLMSGRVEAAVLPDPLASLAILQGAQPILDDRETPELGESVISCRQSVVSEQPGAIQALIAGWDQATAAINQDPDQYRNILIENTRVPDPLQDQYGLPPFPAQTLPTRAQVEDVVRWAREKGLIDQEMSYEEIVVQVRS